MTGADNPNTILITGGCGYIASHTIFCLLSDPTGYSVVIVDNLLNSSGDESVRRAADLAGIFGDDYDERVSVHYADVSDAASFRPVFAGRTHPFAGCVHFAGLKAVGESTRDPLAYYDNNVGSTLVLLRLMEEFGCRSLVFSSSATVYGSGGRPPISEGTAAGVGITNAYGRTKYMIEEILRDFHASAALANKPEWSITILRYFNPVGNHPSGRIGEDPSGVPNNLMPYVAQVAIGRRPHLTVFGGDYDTPDGTGVRDYLHVMDLAEGHLAALRYMDGKEGLNVFNLGTGIGYSVLDMVVAMEKACGHAIKYEISDRRPGDLATVYSDANLAKREMGWDAKLNLDDMCRDLWAWQSNNPEGYPKEGDRKRKNAV